ASLLPQCYDARPHPPSFPTRRSSDLATPEPGDISLAANGYKVRGLQKADLTWNGATSTNVDVYRNGVLITTTANDGFYTDNIDRSEEHTSELQSRENLVCRLLLEKKK